MKKTSKIILMSVLTIVACVSLISGATFALFTSESNINIAVTSGKVDVTATVDSDSIQLYSYEKNEADEYVSTLQAGSNFAMGGSASFIDDGSALTLDKMVPGDKATFSLNIANASNVDIKYKYTVSVTGEQALFDALEVKLGEEEFITGAFDASTSSTVWKEWHVGDGDIPTIEISVELPYTYDDNGGEGTVQGQSCELSFVVNAVQGNAKTVDASTTALTISNAKEFANFVQSVNSGNSYAGQTISLADNIDLSEVEWEPIGTQSAPFSGTFDGNGFTISALSVTAAQAGLLGVTQDATIENLKIVGANVVATDGGSAGILVGEAKGTLTVRNVYIKDATVQMAEGASSNQYVGALVGLAGTPGRYDAKVAVYDTEIHLNNDARLCGTTYGQNTGSNNHFYVNEGD